LPVVLAILPFFALIFLGYAAGRTRLFDATALKGLNTFVFYIAMPPLLFRLAAGQPLPAAPWRLLASYALAELVTLVLAGLLLLRRGRRDPADAVVGGLAASFSNGVFMALPISVAVLGSTAALPALLLIVLDSLFLFAAAVLALELLGAGRAGRGPRLRLAGLKPALLNPQVLAIVGGLAAALVGLSLPEVLEQILDLLGRAAAPCALVGLGATLALGPARGLRGEVLVLVALKLAVLPALVWLGGSFLFRLPDHWLQVAVLAAGMPTGATAYVVARQYDRLVEPVSAAIVLSTALSLPSVSLLILLLVPG